MICHYAECNYAECRILFIMMSSVIVLNVVMLSVVAPDPYHENDRKKVLRNFINPIFIHNQSKKRSRSHQSCSIEQRSLKNENNYLNTNIYSYLETSGGQSCNLYLNVVHFFNTSVN
jgi:hypothetical protein